MNDLRLRVDKDLEGEVSLAIVDVLSTSGDTIFSGAVPVGYQATPEGIPLEPGAYVVRVRFPSGEMLTREVTMGDASRTLDLESRSSGHEWLSWHEISGGRGVREERSAVAARFLEREPLAREILREGEAPSLLIEAGTRLRAKVPLTMEPYQEVTEGGMRFSVRMSTDEQYVSISIVATPEPGLDPRHWPRVHLGASVPGGDFGTVALPTPWPDPNGAEGSCAVEVLLARPGRRDAGQSRARSSIASLVVRDRVFGPLLAFLAAGDPGSARAVSARMYSEARQMLWAKLANPYAAAAGGYVLLRTMGRYDSPEKQTLPDWYKWPKNLANWFEWLPDGAIIFGWQELLRGRQGIQAARRYFIRATERDLPIYTEGVRLLYKGLRLLSLDPAFADDSELRIALQTARAQSMAIDPAMPFSTILERRDETRTKPPVTPAVPSAPEAQREMVAEVHAW